MTIRHRLEHSLILLDDYMHPLFGAPTGAVRPLLALKQTLGDCPDGYDSSGRSFLAQRLRHRYGETRHRDPAELDIYDDNVRRHLTAINARRPQDETITLKYFQLLALLYTEHVLQRTFLEQDAFLAGLNACVAARNARERHTPFARFTAGDLSKLAYWMATGSGKTLLLHINYHQMRHYLALARRQPYENILLITPNAGLSRQHLHELRLSSVPAQIFRQNAPRVAPGAVQIIEITKFTGGKTGPLTVNIDHFEGRNLVFVDEGHRGASGAVWFGYRDKLAAQGFTFEYSATFGEAFNSGNQRQAVELRHVYGKTIVFDYSYRYFHGDGYGKDYNILNLPHSYHSRDRDTLLLANLLTLYEQTWIYLENQQQMRDYNLERPLLIFVGRTVQTGKTRSQLGKADKTSLSDVLDITRCLHRVVHDRPWAEQTIAAILRGQSGLTDEHGVDIFHSKFRALREQGAAPHLYAALLRAVFQAKAPGPLHLANLRSAAGEISLRVGTSEIPFGVINIGDDVNFLNMAARRDLGLVVDADDALRPSLFETINRPGSTVNVLLGAKKFTEGWSSWRVSGMGLLNIGRSEGSEVIQMFGRGVRLLGYQRSLKRSATLPGRHPQNLPLLETLNIFSVNGDYLAQFKQALGREGIIEGYEEISLPLCFDAFESERPALYVLRPHTERDFCQQPAFSLAADPQPNICPTLDLLPRVQVASSQEAQKLHADRAPVYLSEAALALLDWDALVLDMLAWRRQRGFSNLAIHPSALRKLLALTRHNGHTHSRYYTLYAPPDLVAPRSFADVPRVQAIALAILKQYTERFYNYHHQQWQSEHNLEYRILDQTDPNMLPATLGETQAGYVIKVNRDKPELIAAVQALVEQGQALYQQDQADFPSIVFDRHLYTPLVAQGYYRNGDFTPEPDIKSVPVGLNRGEARFVHELRQVVQGRAADLGARQLYLLRNLSRGKGIGFFEGDSFYPDFILWLVDGPRQAITFIDPKGLAMLNPNGFSHPKIQLFRKLRDDIAPRLNNPNVTLDSYIISTESHAETVKYFGRRDPREAFIENHVLFPGYAAQHILNALKAQLS